MSPSAATTRTSWSRSSTSGTRPPSQELQEIATTVRSIAEIRRAFTYNALNAIMVRGTADKVALAEKLISDLDKPKPEVVIDVIVMQANRDRVRDLAATITTGRRRAGHQSSHQLHRPGRTTTTAGETTRRKPPPSEPVQEHHPGRLLHHRPGALLQAVMSDSQTRVIQQPQLRADREPEGLPQDRRQGARMRAAAFTPAVGGRPGLHPVCPDPVPVRRRRRQRRPDAQGSWARGDLDARRSRDLERQWHRWTIAGRQAADHQPAQGASRDPHQEGEVTLLGGLMCTPGHQEPRPVSRADEHPILAPLLQHRACRAVSDIELLIALIPHIVRAPEFNEVNRRGVAGRQRRDGQAELRPPITTVRWSPARP